MQFVRRHLETILVSAIVAAVTAGAPAIAHGVQHALFAHKAGIAENSKAFGGKSPAVFETQMSTATTKLESSFSHTSRAPGETATQTIKISNAGPGTATGLDLLASAGSGWTPAESHPKCSVGGAGISCANLLVKKGASTTITVTWTAACPPGGFPALPMIVQLTGWKYDTTPANNSAQHTLTTTGCPAPGA